MMMERTIRIEIDENGNFTYRPSGLHICHTDTVTWTCADGPFAVSFMDRSPLVRLDAQGTQSSAGWSTQPLPVAASARPGHYHYAVALYTDNEGKGPIRVHLDASCPEIIVNMIEE